jgi:dipeptidyl aminopeptidase/acylaminoacyl peptidase
VTRRFRWYGLAASVAGTLLLVPALIAFRAYRSERAALRGSPHPPRLSVSEFQIAGLRAVSFNARDGARLAGVYAPPSTKSKGAAVVLVHGSGGERSDLASEAKLLADEGFGVLSFDLPGYGESPGQPSWDEPERQALRGALDWLERQPGVDPQRLGAFGFSMGGYLLAQVAASEKRVQAVALAGAPHDVVEHTRWEYRRWGVLSQWPALLAIRVSGMKLREQVPEQVVAQIAPRALLVISGGKDDAVPAWMSARLFQAAHEPKQLLIVEQAGHGGYGDAPRESYAVPLLQFFSRLSA